MITESKDQARKDIRGKVLQAIFAIILVGIMTSIATFTLETINPFPTPEPVMGQNFWEQENAYSGEYLPGTVFNLVTSLIFSFTVVSIFTVGLNNFFIRNGQGKELDVTTSLFYGFKSRYKFILKTFFAVIFAVGLYFLGVYALMVAGLLVAVTQPTVAAIISMLVLVGSILAFIKLLDYAFVPYLLADEEIQLEQPKDYLDMSKTMIKGYKLEFILLGLSFILWFIASILTLFLLLIWLIPFVYQSYANFYLKLKPKPDVVIEEEITE